MVPAEETLMNKYEYVSFDIFDTLIFRTVRTPEDIFDIVQMQYELEGGRFQEFRRKRIIAEREARTKYYPKEIKIDQIYEMLEADPNTKASLMKLEKKTEIENCVPNLPMIQLAHKLSKKKKHIIIITDMYLDRDTLVAILNKINMPYEKLYISSEIGLTKVVGNIFPYVLTDLAIQGKQMIHTGDNLVADLKNPQKYGIMSVERILISNDFNGYATYDKKNIAPMQSHFVSFVKEFYRLNKSDESIFRVGFEIIGPLLYEFCRWLHTQKEQHQLDKLLFVAREGYLIMKCYQKMYPNDICDYTRLNRNLLRIPQLKKDILAEQLLDTIPQFHTFRWKDILSYLNLDDMMVKNETIFSEKTLESFVSLTDIKAGKYQKYFDLLWPYLEPQITFQKACLKKYMCEQGFFNQKIGLVNNSMNGTGQKLINDFLTEAGCKSRVMGLQFVRTNRCKKNLGENCLGWLDDQNVYIQSDFSANALLFEHLLFEQTGTALLFGKNKKGIIVRCETQRKEILNAKVVTDIQKFVLKFIDNYSRYPDISRKQDAIDLYMEFLRFPKGSDAQLLGNLYDDDVCGDHRLVSYDEPFKFKYLFEKNVPQSISWKQAYFVIKGMKNFLWIYNDIRHLRTWKNERK